MAEEGLDEKRVPFASKGRVRVSGGLAFGVPENSIKEAGYEAVDSITESIQRNGAIKVTSIQTVGKKSGKKYKLTVSLEEVVED